MDGYASDEREGTGRRSHADPLNVKVLFMSGYTENALAEQGILNFSNTFLEKLFTLEVLARKVSETFDAVS
jgi:hypothetical protein